MGSITGNVLLIGAGKMGTALLAGWHNAGIMENQFAVVDPHANLPSQIVYRSLADVPFIPDIIVLAVKPQSMDSVLSELATRFHPAPCYLSIAAGKTISYFQKHLGGDASIIRAMPNTPALIGKGITALIASVHTSEAQKESAATLMHAAGDIIWLEQESQMDAVTAVSGSGPAYVFLFLEALIDAGRSHGLPEELCRKLAVHTVLGSAELALHSSDTLATLRHNVTSPGGTTEAALAALMKNDGLKPLIADAVMRATQRARELA